MKTRALSLTLPVMAPALLAVIWVALAQRIGNEVILPGIEQVSRIVFHPTQDLISMGSLAANVMVSLVRVIMGYTLAAALAIPLGVVMGYYGFVFKFFNGFLNLFRPIPPWPGSRWSWHGSEFQALQHLAELKQDSSSSISTTSNFPCCSSYLSAHSIRYLLPPSMGYEV